VWARAGGMRVRRIEQRQSPRILSALSIGIFVFLETAEPHIFAKHSGPAPRGRAQSRRMSREARTAQLGGEAGREAGLAAVALRHRSGRSGSKIGIVPAPLTMGESPKPRLPGDGLPRCTPTGSRLPPPRRPMRRRRGCWFCRARWRARSESAAPSPGRGVRVDDHGSPGRATYPPLVCLSTSSKRRGRRRSHEPDDKSPETAEMGLLRRAGSRAFGFEPRLQLLEPFVEGPPKAGARGFPRWRVGKFAQAHKRVHA
jgi:hypothetical protein